MHNYIEVNDKLEFSNSSKICAALSLKRFFCHTTMAETYLSSAKYKRFEDIAIRKNSRIYATAQ
jgi:hypothetical protein